MFNVREKKVNLKSNPEGNNFLVFDRKVSIEFSDIFLLVQHANHLF